MKSIYFTIAVIAFSIAAMAQTPQLNYVTDFETAGAPLAIAADTNGGIYYTVFTFAGANQTACYYIADPINANEADNHVLVTNAIDDTDVPAGRGFTGIAVDAAGHIFLTLESGNNNSATVRKLSPAPDFEPVEDFFGGIVFGGKRYNGIDIVDDQTIALSTFTEIDFWDANDSAPLHSVSGGESFQRDVAYNPNTGDFYIAKNRDVAGEPISSANILHSPGNDDIFSYTDFEANFIPQGGAGGSFGINAQLIEYDPVNDWILIPDHTGDQSTLAIYSPSDTSTPLLTLDGSDSETGAVDTPSDSVSVQDENGDTWVFITDNSNTRIYVYSTKQETGIHNWELF